MELVESSPSLFPGCCFLCKGVAAPLVDTQRFSVLDERLYVCGMCALGIAQASGGCGPAEKHRLAVQAAEAEGLREELEEARQELGRLKDAVRTTLARGGVAEGDGFKLRPKPGQKAVSV